MASDDETSNQEPEPSTGKPIKLIFGNKPDLYKLLWASKYSPQLQALPQEMIREIASHVYKERDYQVNDLIDVLDTVKKWYPCIIKDVREGEIFIHYFGWTPKFDEWIKLDSPRLAPLFTHDQEYGRKGGIHPGQQCAWCDKMKPLCDSKQYVL